MMEWEERLRQESPGQPSIRLHGHKYFDRAKLSCASVSNMLLCNTNSKERLWKLSRGSLSVLYKAKSCNENFSSSSSTLSRFQIEIWNPITLSIITASC